MSLKRLPRASLRPFVSLLWASEPGDGPSPSSGAREHVLPSGEMHLVFRLSDDPLRIFSSGDDRRGHAVDTAVVGGARTAYYIRDVSAPACSVGAMLRPGAAQLLFGAPADALAGRHTSLGELWGSAAESTRSRLLEARDPERRLDELETLLDARLPGVHGLHPAMVNALAGLQQQRSIEVLVRESRYSHRHFDALFRSAVGVGPKAYARVLRFGEALRLLAIHRHASLAAIASRSGYSDQAHFTRAFVEMAGVTPSVYQRRSTTESRHVALPTRAS